MDDGKYLAIQSVTSHNKRSGIMSNKIPVPKHSRFRSLFGVSVAMSFIPYYIPSMVDWPDRMDIAYSGFRQKVKEDRISAVNMTDQSQPVNSELCGVDPGNVHVYIIGEHGAAALPVWSNANIGGMIFAEYCSSCNEREPL
jgi:hypothetical protein